MSSVIVRAKPFVESERRRNRKEKDMSHVSRAWRRPSAMRLLVMIGVFGAAALTVALSSPQRSSSEDRAPTRVIHDSYPTYSAIAVDHGSNLILLQDENLFGIKEFDRLTNTPPNARFSEPKRVIAGDKTKMEFNCGLYIDPRSGDVYSITNDTVDTMAVFSRSASGNVAPDRELHTPHRTYGITVDEANNELFLTVQHPPAVM